ncbi:hypothetical protein Tco_1433516, partial [Tanacetum coccineum]
SLDSSSPSAGPSRKRCRSPTTLVPSSTLVSRLIAPALADPPPRKRFRDSYSSDVSGEEHIEIGTTDAKTITDLGVSDGVRASRERVGLADRVRSLGRENLREEFRQIRRDRDNTRRRLKRLESLVERNLGFRHMEQDSAHMVAASKVPMLKPGEYEIWRMRIEQYIQMIDYALWEVIENGATLPKTTKCGRSYDRDAYYNC